MVICAKTAEPIEMPFGLSAWMGPRNRVRWGPDPPHGKGQFWGNGAPIVKCSGTLRSITCAKAAELIVMRFGWARTGPRNHELDGGPDTHEKGKFWGKGRSL